MLQLAHIAYICCNKKQTIVHESDSITEALYSKKQELESLANRKPHSCELILSSLGPFLLKLLNSMLPVSPSYHIPFLTQRTQTL